MAALSFGTKILAELILARRTRQERAFEPVKHGVRAVSARERIEIPTSSQPLFFPVLRRNSSTHRARSGASSHSNDRRFPVDG